MPPLWAVGLGLGVFLALWRGRVLAEDFERDHGGGGTSDGGGPMSTQGNVANLSDAFWQKLWEVANDLGADPRTLGLLLFEESGINPAAKNSIGCVGINQFCPGTFSGFVDVSVEDYLALSAEEQLDPYVKKYWAAGPSGSLATPRDIFWRSLWPATWKPNAPASAVVLSGAPGKANTLGGRVTGPDWVMTAAMIDDYLADVAGASGWQLALQKISDFDPGQAVS